MYHSPNFDGVPILLQEIEESGIAIGASRQHAENQIHVIIREIPVLLQDGDVKQSLNLFRLIRTSRQRL